MINLVNISKYFNHTTALNHINFQVKKNTSLLIAGHNGSGKTTLLKIIAAIIRPSTGTISIHDSQVSVNNLSLLNTIGLLSDQSMLYRELSIRENLHLFARIYKVPNPDTSTNQIMTALNITKYADKKIKELSLGIEKRTALARAVIHAPELLLLDEPFSGLDLNGRILVLELLSNLRQSGKTILITSHDIDICYPISDQYLILKDGQIFEQGLSLPDGLTDFMSRLKQSIGEVYVEQ